jgi:DNA-binding SARP family transcriptional activator/TolB-like protein/Flp pilus assembly protein TadD
MVLIELRTLGRLDLRLRGGASIQSVLAQPKRTALLLYLALARPRGLHQRERLLGLFWGEMEEERARKALRQSLYFLRGSLGEKALEAVADSVVGVSRERVWCDAVELDRALEEGRAEDALGLYGGELLPGFYIDDAPEFERWLEAEREWLRSRAAEAAWQLAEKCEVAGEAGAAVEWARKAAAFSPADETVARRLMALLERVGDRAAAVRAYEAYAGRLEQEYGLEPSAETQGLVEAIRHRPQLAASGSPARNDGAVGSAPGEPHGAAAPPPSPERRDSPPVARRRSRWRRLAARPGLLAIAVAIPATAAYLLLGHRRERPRDAASLPGRQSPPVLAVLPLTNRSQLDADAMFVDGIHAEVVTFLGRIQGLQVKAPSWVMIDRDRPVSVRRIAEELEIDYVIEGGVGRSGDSVRVDVRLVDAHTGDQLWSQPYVRELTPESLLRIQSDIARRVAISVQAELSADVAAKFAASTTENPDAYAWFLRGASVRFVGYVERDIRTRITYYEQAVRLDSAFARAWAALAIAQADLYWFFEPTASRAEAAHAALEEAEKLAPDDPDTRLASGVYAYRVRRSWDDALAELDVARRVLPSDHRIYYLEASIKRRKGRWDDAVKDWVLALDMAPLSAGIQMEVGVTYFLMRRYDEAIEYLRKALAADPDLVTAATMLAWAVVGRDGDTGEGVRILARTTGGRVVPSEHPYIQYTQVVLQLLDGNPERALEVLDLDVRDFLDYQFLAVPPALLRGQVHAILGQRESSLADLQHARRVLEARLEMSPDDARLHSALGLTFAGLGDAVEAVRHAERAVELAPLASDAWFGCYYLEDLAMTHAMLGNADAAIAIFETLLDQPGPLSRAQLRLDPRLAGLRSDSRFQRIIRE